MSKLWRPVDNELLVVRSKNFFLGIQCPKISILLFKDGAHFITWCEWLHFFDDLPFDVEVDGFVF